MHPISNLRSSKLQTATSNPDEIRVNMSKHSYGMTSKGRRKPFKKV
jgi:hypothetical protein